jgi:drug/metabolite transporter (DMT)-like permease
MIRKQPECFATGSLLLAVIIWGSSLVALKLAFRTYDPMVVIFSQMAVASLCFLFFIKRFRGIKYQKSDTGYVFLLALCEPCLYFIFEAWALENTTASQAGMIMSMQPSFF